MTFTWYHSFSAAMCFLMIYLFFTCWIQVFRYLAAELLGNKDSWYILPGIPWEFPVLFFDTYPAVWDSPQFHCCHSHTQCKSVPVCLHFYQKAGRQLSLGSCIKSTVAIWQQRSSVAHWLQARIPLSLCWIRVHFSTFPVPVPYCRVKGAEGKVQNIHQQFWLSNIQNNQNMTVLMAPGSQVTEIHWTLLTCERTDVLSGTCLTPQRRAGLQCPEDHRW